MDIIIDLAEDTPKEDAKDIEEFIVFVLKNSRWRHYIYNTELYY